MDTAGLAGFREFVAARQTALLRSAYVLCGDRHRAEDLVQGAVIVDSRTGRVLARPATPVTAVHGWVDATHVVAEVPAGLVLLAPDGTTRPYAARTGEATDPGITRAGP